jgi:hypothetical protein
MIIIVFFVAAKVDEPEVPFPGATLIALRKILLIAWYALLVQYCFCVQQMDINIMQGER